MFLDVFFAISDMFDKSLWTDPRAMPGFQVATCGFSDGARQQRHLVGGIVTTPLKNMSSSVGTIIPFPILLETTIHVPVTTNQT